MARSKIDRPSGDCTARSFGVGLPLLVGTASMRPDACAGGAEQRPLAGRYLSNVLPLFERAPTAGWRLGDASTDLTGGA